MNPILSLAQPFLILSTVLLLSFLPAWGLARRLKCDPLTQLAVAVMGTCTCMYLLEFGTYLFSLPAWIPFCLCLIAAVISLVDAIRNRHEIEWRGLRQGILAWAGLAVWILAIQFQVVVYGECCAFGDWHEHYQRSLFFLNQLPPETKFLYDLWPLAARGPIFNTVAAVFLGGFGKDFWIFQTVATVLNTFVILPFGLLLRDMAGLRQRSALLLGAILLALSPLAVTFELRTETKFLALGFLLGGIHLYQKGLQHKQPWLVTCSFAVLASGFLTHYYLFIYSGFFVFHFIHHAVRNKWTWRSLAYPVSGGLLLVAPWFIYLSCTFGVSATFNANDAIGNEWSTFLADRHKKPLVWEDVFAGNLISSTIPYSYRRTWSGTGSAPPVNLQISQFNGNPVQNEFDTSSAWYYETILNYGSLPGNLGWTGAIALILIILMQRTRIRAGKPGPERAADLPGRTFWIMFFALGLPLNIAAMKEYQMDGMVFIYLQPYVVLSAVFLIRWALILPALAQRMLIYGFIIESLLPLSSLIQLDRRWVPITMSSDDAVYILGELDFYPNYLNNFILKLKSHSIFLSDRYEGFAGTLSLVGVILALSLLTAGLKVLRAENTQRQSSDA